MPGPSSHDAATPRRRVEDRYELDHVPLARGGMGEVWTGYDTTLEREVAVKFVRLPGTDEDRELTRRFIRETRITARLQHPGVPAVYDVGSHEGRPYLVMQRIRGISVADLIAERERLSVAWSAAIAAQVCAVLAAAHLSSLVHRDLKPANLILEPAGTVKVLDFGLAVALDGNDLSKITRTGQSLGTPAYMAPEQVLAGRSGPRTDLYAVGCLLYEMLTGQQVFTGATAYSVMNQQVDQAPVPLLRVRPDVPVELDTLVTELLRKDPEDRPADADAVYRRLLPHISAPEFIPGILHPPNLPNPARMFAEVVARIPDRPTVPNRSSADAPSARARRGETAETGESSPDAGRRRGLARARRDAAELASRSRYAQAADVLEHALESAEDGEPTLLPARRQLADALFDGGEFQRAAPLYERLLAEDTDADADQQFHYRIRAATCHALRGDASTALAELSDLLAVGHQRFGPDDDRMLELRRQIGLLQLGSGHRADAEQTLQALLADLVRLRGSNHPGTVKVRDLLASLRSGAQ